MFKLNYTYIAKPLCINTYGKVLLKSAIWVLTLAALMPYAIVYVKEKNKQIPTRVQMYTKIKSKQYLDKRYTKFTNQTV